MRSTLITAMFVSSLMCIACSQQTTATEVVLNPADKTQIEAAVMDYFEGQGQGSLERLDRAFNDNAAMFGVVTDETGNSGLKVWTDMNDVVKNWSKNPNPDSPERDSEIYDIHVTDDRIATVHFRSTDRFYDVLTLVKIDNRWEIASKVFVRQ